MPATARAMIAMVSRFMFYFSYLCKNSKIQQALQILVLQREKPSSSSIAHDKSVAQIT